MGDEAGVGGFIPAQRFTGDAVFLHGFLGDLFLPLNYISGAPLTILIGNSVPQVPEPGTLALLALGLTSLALSRKRKAN